MGRNLVASTTNLNAFFMLTYIFLTHCNGSINQEIIITLIQNVLRCHFLQVGIPCMTFYDLEIKEINDDSGSVYTTLLHRRSLKTNRSFISTEKKNEENIQPS